MQIRSICENDQTFCTTHFLTLGPNMLSHTLAVTNTHTHTHCNRASSCKPRVSDIGEQLRDVRQRRAKSNIIYNLQLKSLQISPRQPQGDAAVRVRYRHLVAKTACTPWRNCASVWPYRHAITSPGPGLEGVLHYGSHTCLSGEACSSPTGGPVHSSLSS